MIAGVIQRAGVDASGRERAVPVREGGGIFHEEQPRAGGERAAGKGERDAIGKCGVGEIDGVRADIH